MFMSSLARRSLRTTAAAAGIAALGVGFAGHAFAAPEAPALPGTDILATPELPNTTGGAEMLEEFMAAPETGEAGLPGLLAFEMPTVNMASPAQTSNNDVDADAVGMERFSTPNTDAVTEALSGFGAPMLPAAGPNIVGAPASPGAPPAPEAPAVPAAPGLPGAPEDLAKIIDTGSGLDQVNGPEMDAATIMETNRVGAMSEMDTAAMFADMIQKALAGESVTQDNAING